MESKGKRNSRICSITAPFQVEDQSLFGPNKKCKNSQYFRQADVTLSSLIETGKDRGADVQDRVCRCRGL